jgi:hypothetical protein
MPSAMFLGYAVNQNHFSHDLFPRPIPEDLCCCAASGRPASYPAEHDVVDLGHEVPACPRSGVPV